MGSEMCIRESFLTHGHLDHTWGLLPLLQTLDLDGRRNPMVVMGPSTRAAIDWATQHPGETPPENSGISSTDLAILFSQWQAIGVKDADASYPIDWVLIPIDDDNPFKSPIQPLEGVSVTIVPTHHGVPSCGYHFESNGGMENSTLSVQMNWACQRDKSANLPKVKTSLSMVNL